MQTPRRWLPKGKQTWPACVQFFCRKMCCLPTQISMPRKKTVDYVLVQKLYGEGLNDCQIAKKLNCVRTTVQTWRKQNNLPPHIRPTCTLFSLSKDKFIELWNKNMPILEIGRELKISISTVRKWERRLNLEPRRKGLYYQKRQLMKRAFYLYKIEKMDFEEIAWELKVSKRRAQELVGYAIMQQCRMDEKCPYKALLPENL